MTNPNDKKVYASLFMVLLIVSPLTVMGDNSFCTASWAKIHMGGYVASALRTDGSLYSWGVNQFGTLGLGSGTLFQTVPARVGTDTWQMIAMNEFFTVGLKSNGRVFGWGMNTFGSIGDAAAVGGVAYTPAQITGFGNNVKFVAAHGLAYTSYAVRTNGQLWAVGDNSHAQLGVSTGTVSSTATPRRIGTDSDWDYVVPAARDSHVCGLKLNGSLYCWGENYYSQVGDGTMVDRAAPLRIGSASDTWKKVIVNQYYTLALHNDGRLFGFGTTFWGVFGNGQTYSQLSVPTQIAGSKLFDDIAAFDTFVVAVGKDGKLYGWGDNTYTQVNSNAGVGIQTTPNQITSGTNWSKVFASRGISMNAIGSAFALRNNGRLFAWGSNNVGQLGIGSNAAAVSTPTAVLAPKTFASDISVGYTSAAIDTDGQLYMTGFNNFNLLGDGTIDSSNTFFSCANRSANCNAHVCSARLRF